MSNPATPQPYDRRSVFAWAVYDFANSAFTTLIVTFIYATYFANAIAPDAIAGTDLWSIGVSVTAIIVALLSPYAGAIADQGGYRKRFLLVTTAFCIAASIGLYFPQQGQVTAALVWFVLANVAFEMANVFYNAFLPDLAPKDRIGFVSGYGWAMGYAGGLVCLVIALYVFVDTDTPLFGLLTKEADQHIRATNLLVAAWYALFSLPLFLMVREVRRPSQVALTEGLIRSANRQIAQTFREVRRFRQVFRLLVARLIYNDGLITIFAFGGIYAQGTFGFAMSDVIVFGIALNVAAGLGAFAFGFLDDRIGGRRTILITILGLMAATALAAFTQSVTGFWVAGILVGLLAGPNQAASRSLLARFTPPTKENEFFGFFAFSGKFTSFLGPLLLGQLTAMYASQRIGVASLLVFFVVGAVLLLRVDEEEGIQQAEAGL